MLRCLLPIIYLILIILSHVSVFSLNTCRLNIKTVYNLYLIESLITIPVAYRICIFNNFLLNSWSGRLTAMRTKNSSVECCPAKDTGKNTKAQECDENQWNLQFAQSAVSGQRLQWLHLAFCQVLLLCCYCSGLALLPA